MNSKADQNPRRRSYVWIAVSIFVTAAAFVIAFMQADLSAFWPAIRSISLPTMALAGSALLFGALLAALRLWFIARDVGHRLSTRDALLALSVGQVAGAVTVQFFGQIVARSALLSPRGISAPANIVMVTYERLVAVAISGLLATAGAWYLFGRLAVDLQGGGDRFVKIVLGIVAVVLAGGAMGWGRAAVQRLVPQFNRRVLTAILRSGALTVAIQLATAIAYVAVAHALAPQVLLGDLFAASVIVMFAASLPISFSGWGVRELSAVLALSAIGLKSSAALAVAVIVGVLALASVVVTALVAVLMPGRSAPVAPSQATGTGSGIDLVAVVKWSLAVMTASAVFFQIHVPIGMAKINVNLADPLAILGGGLFAIYFVLRARPAWRLPGLDWHIAAASLVVLLAFLHGYFVFGLDNWAVTKAIGWPILLAYGATGALVVRVGGDAGLRMLLRTFVGCAVGIVMLELTFLALTRSGAQNPFTFLPFEGFSQNRNAFGFLLTLALCCVPLLPGRDRTFVLTVLILGFWFCGSRACTIAALTVLACGAYLRVYSTRNLLYAPLFASFCLLALWSLPLVASLLAFRVGGQSSFLILTGAPDLSNIERFESIMNGLRLFIAHPLFGAGLGAYWVEQLGSARPVVVHSTPIWLLSEFGLVGLLVFAVPAVRIFVREIRLARHDKVAALIVLILVGFGLASAVHELLYQRAMWLLLGALLAANFTIGMNKRSLRAA